MAFIPIPDGARAVLEFQTVLNPWSLTLNFVKVDFVEQDMRDLAATITASFIPDLLLALQTGTTFTGITVYDMRSETAPKVVDIPPVPPAGARPGSPSVVHTAMVVTFYTNARGKTAQGRNYVSGYSENDIDDDSFNITVADITEAAYRTRFVDVDPSGWTFSVASFQEDNIPRAQALTRAVTGVEVRSRLVGSQRRRVRRN